MTIIKSTDGRYVGQRIPNVNKGDSVNLGDFVFYVQNMTLLENGHTLISNPTYQLELECEE